MLLILGAVLLTCGFICSTLLCGVGRSIARRLNFVDHPSEERKIHTKPIALGGGIGLLLTLVLLAGGGTLLAVVQQQSGVWSALPQLVRDHIPQIASGSREVFYILAGAVVIALLGFLDDLFHLSPITRLAVQALVATLLCVSSDELRVTAFVGNRGVSLIYTVAWIVGITNAFNLLDNMDGLSAGVGTIAAMMFIVVAIITQQYFLAALLLVFAGSLCGFLVYNFPPASLFMGDAGSMFIGYMLSVLTIRFTFYMPGAGMNPMSAMLVPLVILAVPLYDTLSVAAIRVSQGRSIFSGDRNHFSHRLVELGMSKRSAVLTIYLTALCTGVLAPLLLHLSTGMSLLVFANVALMLILIWLLEHVGRRSLNGEGNGK
jgi:UDP-GlcNAc:undecaprenyl-phosphate/decaprenyl-phosphate GlcNAc-1-phosphate transferase